MRQGIYPFIYPRFVATYKVTELDDRRLNLCHSCQSWGNKSISVSPGKKVGGTGSPGFCDHGTYHKFYSP